MAATDHHDIASGADGAAGEFRRGWRIVVGSSLGIGVGILALPFSTAGFFMPLIEREFGWSRTALSLAPTILIAGVALASPAVGWLADRMPPLRIIAASMLAICVAFLALSAMPESLVFYYGSFLFMALAGAGASTLLFARIVSAAFECARGLALGLSLMGNGITNTVLPALLVPFLAEHGWRTGYRALALLLFLAMLVILLLLRGSVASPSLQRQAESRGATVEQAFRSSAFWMMAVAFFLGTLAAAGMIIHFVPLLTDAGVGAAEAGATASLIGISLIAGRVVTGWLMDRFNAARVGAAMMAVSSGGILIFAVAGAPAAPAGAVAIGLCVGAELDVIGYLTGRFFGMRAYGRIYGFLYAACLVGTSLSPILYGAVTDAMASYYLALLIASALLAGAALLLFLLPTPPAHRPAESAKNLKASCPLEPLKPDCVVAHRD